MTTGSPASSCTVPVAMLPDDPKRTTSDTVWTVVTVVLWLVALLMVLWLLKQTFFS